MSFSDSHCHMHFPEFDPDREIVLEKARAEGLKYLVNIGTDIETTRQAVCLAEKYPFCYASAGIHPHETVKAGSEALHELEALLKHPRVVGLGEVGLDFFRDHSPKDVQLDVFKKILGIHQRVKKPLIIHCRDAYGEMLHLLKEHLEVPIAGVMHCFSSNKEVMDQFLRLGFYISFAGPLTYKKSDELKEACKFCPLDRILFETDAPYLAPQAYRGKRNEPAYVLETIQAAAQIHGIPKEELALISTENIQRLFQL